MKGELGTAEEVAFMKRLIAYTCGERTQDRAGRWSGGRLVMNASCVFCEWYL